MKTQKTIDLLLVARDPLYRRVISELILVEADFNLAAECSCMSEAWKILESGRIDVVVLELDPSERDAEFLRQAAAQPVRRKILLLAHDVNDYDLGALARAGICGIFETSDPPASLRHAIQDVAAGNVWFRLNHLRPFMTKKPLSTLHPPGNALTARQKRVLSLLCGGLKNREIGVEIGVSESSVKATVQQLFAKFGVRSKNQLTRIALEHAQQP